MRKRRRRKNNLIVIFEGIFGLLTLIVGFFVGAIVLFIEFLSFLFKVKSEDLAPEEKGNIAEAKVNSLIAKYIKNKDAVFYSDIIIGEDNQSSQIDHLLATTNAIYVIETKNYTGEIQGDTRETKWFRINNYTGSKNSKINEFVNPFVQNNLHILRLQKLVQSFDDFDVYNIVCFNDNENLDLTGILLKNEEYVLATTKSLTDQIDQIEDSYEESNEGKTTNINLVMKKEKLKVLENQINEQIISDYNEIENHTKRLKLRETKRKKIQN
jgi:hypothetical protein